jgi:hypothetical protein
VDIGICGFIGRIHARAFKAMPGVSICLPTFLHREHVVRALQVSLAARQSAESLRPVEIRPAGDGKTGWRSSRSIQ